VDNKSTQYKRGFRHKQQQTELKAKYGIEKSVIVVEQKSTIAQTVKVILSFCLTLLRIVATILLVVLAVIGLSAIIYPNIRQQLIITIGQIVREITQMLGGVS